MRTKWWIPLAGILLLAGVILTRDKSLSDRNTAVYDAALALEGQTDTGFDTFRFSSVPVRFFDGEIDYVRRGTEFVREKPVLPMIAATVVEHEGEWTLLVPTIELTEGMLNLLMPQEEAAYSDTWHAAVLWHEGFHAWQMEHFGSSVHALPGFLAEDAVLAEADAQESAGALYQQATQLLAKAVQSADDEEMRHITTQYLQLTAKRDRLLPEEVRQAEKSKETVEGTAYYVEMKAVQAQGENIGRYMELPEISVKGSAKYYQSGMLIWKILRRLDPEAVKNYDFTVYTRDLLADALKER